MYTIQYTRTKYTTLCTCTYTIQYYVYKLCHPMADLHHNSTRVRSRQILGHYQVSLRHTQFDSDCAWRGGRLWGVEGREGVRDEGERGCEVWRGGKVWGVEGREAVRLCTHLSLCRGYLQLCCSMLQCRLFSRLATHALLAVRRLQRKLTCTVHLIKVIVFFNWGTQERKEGLKSSKWHRTIVTDCEWNHRENVMDRTLLWSAEW